MAGMLRNFQVVRDEDVSGKSGTGVVAVGTQYPSGVCIMEWIADGPSSRGEYPDVAALIEIHGHEGRTRVEWLGEAFDASIPVPAKKAMKWVKRMKARRKDLFG